MSRNARPTRSLLLGAGILLGVAGTLLCQPSALRAQFTPLRDPHAVVRQTHAVVTVTQEVVKARTLLQDTLDRLQAVCLDALASAPTPATGPAQEPHE